MIVLLIDDEERLLTLGARGVIRKPFDPLTLSSQVEQYRASWILRLQRVVHFLNDRPGTWHGVNNLTF